MDPQAAWDELLKARHERDWDRARELAENLLEWMKKKGFPPNTVGESTIGRTWHRAVAEFVCCMTLSDVKAAQKRLTRKRS